VDVGDIEGVKKISRRRGSLLFDNVATCGQIALILKTHTGRPIKEIGDLGIPICSKGIME
jgi:hypothetical protein